MHCSFGPVSKSLMALGELVTRKTWWSMDFTVCESGEGKMNVRCASRAQSCVNVDMIQCARAKSNLRPCHTQYI